jgi:hypothetical protein
MKLINGHKIGDRCFFKELLKNIYPHQVKIVH